MTVRDPVEEDPFEAARRAALALRQEIARAIVGQSGAVEELLACILCGGHALIEGVPGLGKTLLARTVAQAMSLSFRRIQFTPDLLPSDLVGTEVILGDPATGDRREKFMPGPLFANLVLADEINRAPPKTQAALLEAMEERQVTVGGVTYPLPDPFIVLATENPIEQEGTYPLPAAQCDRFLMKIEIDYPKEEEERQIARWTGPLESRPSLVSREAVCRAREALRDLPIPLYVLDAVCRVVRATRPQDRAAPALTERTIACGASPRAARDLLLAAQARAVLSGRGFTSAGDVADAARAVLRHRIILRWSARAEGFDADAVIDRVLAQSPFVQGSIEEHPALAGLLA